MRRWHARLLSRRQCLVQILEAGAAGALALPALARTTSARQVSPPLAIGTRRELLVDDFLIDRLSNVALKLQFPEPREVVIICDQLWEGNTSAYYTLFQDDDRFRMYYRGAHFDEAAKKEAHPEFACYAESRDGIHWTKPELGLVEFRGSNRNNIIWDGVGTHNFTPFKDSNPACKPEARYKALAVGGGKKYKHGLYAFQSPDGIRWSLMTEEPVITDGAFDSQNLAFWHPERKLYFDFHRKGRDGVRDIMTATSQDFLHWTPPVFLEYGDAPKEHLYTNAIQPYFRAPHLFLGFPTRFQPKHEQVEPILMTSRDGRRFHRWSEPLIPITAPQERDGNRSNYMTRGILQLPGNDRDLSVYATEAYYKGPGSRVRRFTFRTDGFVSANSPAAGELLSKLVTFQGNQLEINFKTSAAGSIRAELQDANGKPIPGFGIDDCPVLAGDEIARIVTWKSNPDLGRLAGKPVRLRFVIQQADLFALKFDETTRSKE